MNAHDAILAWCRNGDHTGIPCMRERSETRVAQGEAKCVVIDNAYFSALVIADGATWEDVAQKLEIDYQ